MWELLWDAPLSPQPFHSPGWWATPASDLVALLGKTLQLLGRPWAELRPRLLRLPFL